MKDECKYGYGGYVMGKGMMEIWMWNGYNW